MLDVRTPAIWFPGQTQEESELMLLRAKVTDAFLKGEVNADFFLNFLSEMGVDVFEASKTWDLANGFIL
jgi:hypothetical protein